MSPSEVSLIRELLIVAPRGDRMTLEERRVQYDRAATVFQLPDRCSVETGSIRHMQVEWIRPARASDRRTLLYFHGGGYLLGSPTSHRHLVGAIADAAGATAVVPHYRRAPEHVFPSAVDDAETSFRYLVDEGILPSEIVLAGDSAGAGLVLACLLRLRDAGLEPPAAAVCLSPWVNLTCCSRSYDEKAELDPVLQREGLMAMAEAYLSGHDARDPLASPVFADLAGLPDLLIQVGAHEVLLDDAVGLAVRARAAGADVTLEIWPEMIHVWQWYLSMLDEATRAVATMGQFIERKLGAAKMARERASA